MRIDRIRIEGFRGIEDGLVIDLNPKFNLIIGENGSGKTAILEAIAVGMSAFFLGMPGIPSRTIKNEDIKYIKTLEGSFEFAARTRIFVEKGILKSPMPAVVVPGKNPFEIDWYKVRVGLTGKTKHGTKSPIKIISNEINSALKDSKRKTVIDLPVLAYYSTARLWKEGRDNKKDEEKSMVKNLPSRYRGYKDALETKSTFKIMLEWFKGKYSDLRISGKPTVQIDCVKKVIIGNVPGATDMNWIFDSDKINTLYISFANGDEIPFNYLSDGYRNFLAIFADLAYRCVTLNPHFGADANLLTEGMVLIDELDLHLHPAWQKNIVQQLKDTFPKVQFVATTHSPFIIQETEEGELYKINEIGKISIGGAEEYSLEDIAEYIQKVKDPAWSVHKRAMYDAAKEYYDLLSKLIPGTPTDEIDKIRDKLNILGKAYSNNVAYTAFLEQERFLAEQKLN